MPASAMQLLRGFYGAPGSLVTAPGNDFVWSLAEHPELVSAEGLDFYFEGLKIHLDARIEVDVLNDDGVPINRVYPTQGEPEPHSRGHALPFTLTP